MFDVMFSNRLRRVGSRDIPNCKDDLWNFSGIRRFFFSNFHPVSCRLTLFILHTRSIFTGFLLIESLREKVI